MNQTSVILVAVALGCLKSWSQTNSLPPRRWFSLPAPQLRPLQQESEASVSFDNRNALPAKTAFSETPAYPKAQGAGGPSRDYYVYKSEDNRLPDQMTLVQRFGEFDYRAYRLIEENGYLKRPEPGSDSVFVRAMNGIFEPATFRIGKTTVACSVVTAIKKKNPLCLINPLVLSVSW